MVQQKFFPNVLNGIKTHKKWVILLAVVLIANLFVVLISYRNGIGMGDGSTFFSFARNLVAGEVYYQDFIHFRTPGSYVLFALGVSLFGDMYASFNLALLIESRVLYPLVFLASFMIIFNKKYFIGAVLAASLLFILPEYAQLRTVLGLLAVAILAKGYITAMGSRKKLKLNKYLLVSGVVTGFAFIFGQEAGLMAGSLAAITILAFSVKNKEGMKNTIQQYLRFGLGFLIGLSPLLIYILINGQLFNFLYYTFYYALVRQPHFMDLIFPPFSYTNFVYYLPFIMILVSTLLLGSIKNAKTRVAFGMLIAFTILRLATHVGRTDIGHLLFVVPELLVVGIMGYALVIKEKAKLIVSRNLIVTLLTLTGVFFAVINDAPSLLLPVAALATVFYVVGSIKDRELFSINSTHVASLGLALSFLFLFLITPQIKSEINDIKASVQGKWGQIEINGSKVDKDTYELISKIEASVDRLQPTTLYSYPILPYFYTLAPQHATSFMTYEPQTTVEEQKLSIEQLKESKPEVIIMDPAQATSMSKSLWLINQYIMENYKITETIVTKHIIWILEPREAVDGRIPLSLTKHFTEQGGLMSVQSPDKDIHNGLMFSSGTYNVTVEGSYKELLLSSTKVTPAGCVVVKIHGDQSQKETTVCTDSGSHQLSINEPIKSIEFISQGNEKKIFVIDRVFVK